MPGVLCACSLSSSSELLLQDFSSQAANIPSSAHCFTSEFHWEKRSNSELSLSYYQYKISEPSGLSSHAFCFPSSSGHWSACICQKYTSQSSFPPQTLILKFYPFFHLLLIFLTSTKSFASACEWILVPCIYKQKHEKKLIDPISLLSCLAKIHELSVLENSILNY